MVHKGVSKSSTAELDGSAKNEKEAADQCHFDKVRDLLSKAADLSHSSGPGKATSPGCTSWGVDALRPSLHHPGICRSSEQSLQEGLDEMMDFFINHRAMRTVDHEVTPARLCSMLRHICKVAAMGIGSNGSCRALCAGQASCRNFEGCRPVAQQQGFFRQIRPWHHGCRWPAWLFCEFFLALAGFWHLCHKMFVNSRDKLAADA